MRVLIIGCGYVGLRVGEILAADGHEVSGLRRSAEASPLLTAAGIRPITGDVTQLGKLKGVTGHFDWIINTVSSSRGGAATYRTAFLEGTRQLLQRFQADPPLRFIYTSSTSVYGQEDGSWVDEDSPATPAGETGQILIETENLLLDAARLDQFPAVILRAAGIYGPGRGHLFEQYLRGEARLTESSEHWLNMVHRDDLASAIVEVLTAGTVSMIYNVADNEPVPQREFLRWLDEQIGRGMPQTSPETATGKRGRSNKRVSNRKLRALGWKPAYPTFRQGYADRVAAVVGVR